uniref:Uncharacterized protein n=1 Tax=Setaria viridis TaxID=4556 RepID=A0A4U6UT74_SETVI|nr:hypothetical protein SEVIR_5G156400v2 [Setaria viridis]
MGFPASGNCRDRHLTHSCKQLFVAAKKRSWLRPPLQMWERQEMEPQVIGLGCTRIWSEAGLK